MMQRRSVLKLISGFCAAVVAGIVGIPVVTVFFDSARKKTVQSGDAAQEFGKLKDLPLGVPRKVEVVQAGSDAWDRSSPKPVGSIWLVRRSSEQVDAYAVTCPHLGCAIDFNATRQVFFCPCHDSAFDLATGERLFGPAPRGLDPLPVAIKDGKVFVTYKKFIQGIETRREG